MERQVEKLEDKLEANTKIINEFMSDLRVSLESIKVTLDNLNDYTHSRVHYLMNTDQGFNMILDKLKERMKDVENEQTTLKNFSISVKNRFLDIGVRIFSSTILIFVGIFIERVFTH